MADLGRVLYSLLGPGRSRPLTYVFATHMREIHPDAVSWDSGLTSVNLSGPGGGLALKSKIHAAVWKRTEKQGKVRKSWEKFGKVLKQESKNKPLRFKL